MIDMTDRDEECFQRLVYEMFDSTRFTQDSPVLFDVYSRYGCGNNERVDLLLTPDWSRQTFELCDRLATSLGLPVDEPEDEPAKDDVRDRYSIAFNQSVVAMKLEFLELVRHVLPLSWWWHERLVALPNRTPKQLFDSDETRLIAQRQLIGGLERLISQRDAPHGKTVPDSRQGSHWLIRSDMIWAAHLFYVIETSNVGKTVNDASDARGIADQFISWVRSIPDSAGYESGNPWVFSVNLNRPIDRSTHYSVPTTKADVAQRTFEVTGRGIRWAVVDSGIDATHIAFRKRDGRTGLPHEEPFSRDGTNNTRIKKTYDFSHIRDHLSQVQRRSLFRGRLLDWTAIEKELRRKADEKEKKDGRPGHGLDIPHDEHYRSPASSHGTHVAGIIAANWDPGLEEDDPIGPATGSTRPSKLVVGMCPDIELYDLRVFDGPVGDEFSVISALQFVRHLNMQYENIEIHGANLSLSVFHDVRNFACGRSPVCEESTRLVNNGVVVVAAAGNYGRANFTTPQGRLSEGYRAVSIADPGNADAVITVGSTHRQQPHTYGVSYFSSRGPTGDGRMKPDLVAPGEKVYSTVPGDRVERRDGTSQAAPHVSGAAAMLMSRHRELIGDPVRVKSILVDTATDLGRDRAYQGAGLVDVMRAMQRF